MEKHCFTTTRSSGINAVLEMLENGDVMDDILHLLNANASTGAIRLIANTNRLIGAHRLDFQARTEDIISKRKIKLSPDSRSP
ncbi:MAG: hypothetical protein HHAS10_09440 [Candidatus Altimarinota bacterium]